MRLFRAVWVLGLATSVAPLGACSLDVDKSVSPTSDPIDQRLPESDDRTEASLVSGEAAAISNAPDLPIVALLRAYNDGQIMGVMLASSGGEVFLGEAMQERARNEAVSQYAREMVIDHTAMMQQFSDLSQAANIPPTQSDVILELQQEMDAFQSLLTRRRGSADIAYLELQVRSHQRLANLIDSTFFPQADNPELRAALEFSLEIVSLHQQRAATLLQTLKEGGSGPELLGSP